MTASPRSASPEALAPCVRTFLQTFASKSTTITYQALAHALELQPPNTIHRLTVALEELMREDAAGDRPFIAALVISKRRNGLPAPGFFQCAAALGRFTGDAAGLDAQRFHSEEFAAAAKYWARATVR